MNCENNSQSWENLSMDNMATMPAGSHVDMPMGGMPMGSCCSQPVYECPEERVCHRYICYDVPQE